MSAMNVDYTESSDKNDIRNVKLDLIYDSK